MKQQQNISHHKLVYLTIIIGLLIVIGILSFLLFYYMDINTKQNKSFIKSFYNFDQYRNSNMILTYEKRKEAFIKKADQALYMAKEAGRNKVIALK